MVLALLVTIVVGVAYGASKVVGGNGSGSAATGEVPTIIDRSTFVAAVAVGQGVGMRNLHNQYKVRDAIDRAIAGVTADRTQLEAAGRGATGAQADAVAAALAAEDQLADALGRWRDAVFNLRFAQVAPSQSAVAEATAALTRARDAWIAAGSST